TAQTQVTQAQNALNTAQAALASDQSKNQQSLLTAQAQLATAQDGLKTAQAQQQTDAAKNQQSLLTSQSQVNTAQNNVNTSLAALASDQAKNQQGLDSAKATVDQALSQVLTAQNTLASDQSKQQDSVQTAQNSVDQANAALNKSRAALQTTSDQQGSTLQTAQNQIAQDTAALQTQQANLAQTAAPPTKETVDQAHAQTQAAEAALRLAQANLQAAVLTAPSDGVVSSVSGAVGQLISGGPSSASSASSSTTASGSIIMTLADISTPQVTAQVSEADIGRVQPGQNVVFTVTAFPGRTFTGKVSAIEPSGQTSSNVVTYNVLCTVDPVPAGVQLLPSMTATVTIILERDDGAVLVPNSAIAYAETQAAAGRAARQNATAAPAAADQSGQTQGDQNAQAQPGQNARTQGGQRAGQQGQGGGPRGAGANADQAQGTPGAVFIMQNGVPTLTRVQLGSSDGDNTRVLSGVQPGDVVVTGQGGASQTGQRAGNNAGQARPGGVGGGAVFVGPGPGGPRGGGFGG
ncbi:MAG: HlyD family efflux transporter periplasmic adaptor subunit, partial [Chloroflexi bacterium]|nr:HlyD family efflux transporter periplasmic adaptor subunit [Chloroflexota bacterium]